MNSVPSRESDIGAGERYANVCTDTVEERGPAVDLMFSFFPHMTGNRSEHVIRLLSLYTVAQSGSHSEQHISVFNFAKDRFGCEIHNMSSFMKLHNWITSGFSSVACFTVRISLLIAGKPANLHSDPVRQTRGDYTQQLFDPSLLHF